MLIINDYFDSIEVCMNDSHCNRFTMQSISCSAIALWVLGQYLRQLLSGMLWLSVGAMRFVKSFAHSIFEFWDSW